jgi:hypothetical protein
MTTPPGPPYPPEGYGPPPLGPQHPMGNPGHRFPPTVQQPPREPQPSQAYVPGPRLEPDFKPPSSKGFIGSLLDLNFDYMVTTRMIKGAYALFLVVSTLFCLVVAWYGLGWYLQLNQTLGIMTMIAAPIIWLVQVVITRMALEFFINQFKITEYLRIIKDQGERRGQ